MMLLHTVVGVVTVLCTMLKVVARYRVFEFVNCEIRNELIMRISHRTEMQNNPR
jgi:hypothetical protein